MKEPSPFRIVERFEASARAHGEVVAIPPRSRVVHEGEVLPTDEDVSKLMAASLQLGNEASLGYNRALAMYRPIEMQVQGLRPGRLSTIMSRIGLGQLIPYDTLRVHSASSTDVIAGQES